MAVTPANKIVRGGDLQTVGAEIKSAIADKQDTIADLSAIRSGAALGSTSVQPVDIEDMVEAEPIGSIIPPVNPSEFATKEEVSQLRQDVTGNLMSASAKNALMAVFQKVAFTVPDVSDEIAELNNALFNLDDLVGIEAEYTQGSTVIWSDGVSVLNDLKANLVVKAEYGDGAEVTVTNYTLSGTLTQGTSIITVEYEGFTTTFNVTVTEYGSKMSYTMAEGTIMNKRGRVGEFTYNGYTHTQGVKNYELTSENTRRVFFTNFGDQKAWDSTTGSVIDAYPIKIPKNAVRVNITVSGSNQQIACRVWYKWEGDRFVGANDPTMTNYPYKTANYATGSNTLDLSDVAGRDDTYLFVFGQRVNSASYKGNEPTGITVTFLDS